jgi:putative tricarboxylic transport membrane protein
MGLWDAILLGFSTALTWSNLTYCFIGVFVGTAVGVLPGLGPVATISLLLPFSFTMDIASALILMAGVFYGAQYGGSITAILVRIPGEASAVVTCLDGYALARQGRAGAALGIAAFGSFIAGVLVTVALFLVGPALANVALAFGPAEYTALVLLGLLLVTQLSSGSQISALLMVATGLLLSSVGKDPIYGTERFTFGVFTLFDGLNIALLAMGIFGVAELLVMAAGGEEKQPTVAQPGRLSELLPSRDDWRASLLPILRGTGLGFFLGLLPGGGATLSSFTAYVLERRLAKNPERFGQGAIEGVAGPEAANNAAAQSSFIPLLTLGLPSNAVMALMIGALMMHGLHPGPQLMRDKPELFWGLIASMWVGNMMLVVLNLPLVGIWAKLLTIPYRFLYPAILLICCIGVYSINNSALDVVIASAFGLVGYMLYRLRCEPAPLLLGFILGPLIEENMRRALLISHGDPAVFLQRPISATFLVLTLALVIVLAAPAIRGARERAFKES